LSGGISGTLRAGSTTGAGGTISGSCFLGSVSITSPFLCYPVRVNRLHRLTFLTRAGPAPLQPGATPNRSLGAVLRVPSTSGRALGNVGQGTGECRAGHWGIGCLLRRRPYAQEAIRWSSSKSASTDERRALVNLPCRYVQAGLLSEGHNVFRSFYGRYLPEISQASSRRS
jgi:hypothetical protein